MFTKFCIQFLQTKKSKSDYSDDEFSKIEYREKSTSPIFDYSRSESNNCFGNIRTTLFIEKLYKCFFAYESLNFIFITDQKDATVQCNLSLETDLVCN